jgi:hypothetical protein
MLLLNHTTVMEIVVKMVNWVYSPSLCLNEFRERLALL